MPPQRWSEVSRPCTILSLESARPVPRSRSRLSANRGPFSGEPFAHHARLVDVGEGLDAAVAAAGEPAVVQPDQVQDGRLQVADADPVHGSGAAEVARRAVSLPPLDAAAGQPDGEGVPVVVTAVAVLGVGQPAELAR